MRKGRELLGLPVIEQGSGHRWGEIQDLVLDHEQQDVKGYLLDKGSWFHAPKQIEVTSISQVAEDAFIAAGEPVSVKIDKPCLVSSLGGKPVQTVSGRQLGTIQDVLLDDQCRTIIGYEISDGFISDVLSGRAVIFKHNVLGYERDLVVVEDKLAGMWENGS